MTDMMFISVNICEYNRQIYARMSVQIPWSDINSDSNWREYLLEILRYSHEHICEYLQKNMNRYELVEPLMTSTS